MRCLTLANDLRERGDNVFFVSREFDGNAYQQIRFEGFELIPLNNVSNFTWSEDIEDMEVIASEHQKIDWLIVDHYLLDVEWESKIRNFVGKIMAIDDLADRKHDCDILLDQNYYENQKTRYNELVSPKCIKLLGPAYALLRKEFYLVKEKLKDRTGKINHILVFFGSSDPTNQTEIVLTELSELNNINIKIDVVVGESNPNKNNIRNLCLEMNNVVYHQQVSNISKLMNDADLAFGAGGATTWERCYLGLPSITVAFAENQRQTTEDLAESGAIRYLGYIDELSKDDYKNAFLELFNNPQQVKKMSDISFNIVAAQKNNFHPSLEYIISNNNL